MNGRTMMGAGIGGLSLLVAIGSVGATTAAPVAGAGRTVRGPQATATPCASQYPTYSFIGFDGELLVAGAQDDGVLAGYDNRACAATSANGAGESQYIESTASSSFAGAGLSTTLGNTGEFSGASANAQSSGIDASLLTTDGTTSVGNASFVGTTHTSELFGAGSFMGSGQTRVVPSPGAHGIYEQGDDEFDGAGDTNTVGGSGTFVGTGNGNTISPEASYASIASGYENTLTSSYAAVLGGYKTVVLQQYGAVLGGDGISVDGTLGLAGGFHAMVLNGGSFVWGDYSSASNTNSDQAANQFVLRASGGTTFFSNEAMTSGETLTPGSGTWSSLSDRNAKTSIARFDAGTALAKVRALPVHSWSYSSEAGVRHIGPMAQDFYAAFHVGADNRHITAIDEDGIALAAISGIDRELEATEAHSSAANARQQRELAALAAETQRLERDAKALTRR